MSQLQRKFVSDNAINGQKIRLDNNEVMRARNAADTADINIVKVTAADKVEVQNLFEVSSLLPIPSALKQYATIEYIQNFIKGKTDAKDAVNALIDANIPLTGTQAALDAASDGVVLTQSTPSNRVALTGQSDQVENGVYDVAISGGNYVLTRSSDFDEGSTSGEVTQGAYFRVISGTNYGGYDVQLTTADPIVIGATALTFIKYPSTLSIVAGDMLARVGNTFSIDLANNGGLESTSPNNSAGQLRVKTLSGDLEKDQTVKVDATGNVVSKKPKKKAVVLAAADITNQYIDLLDVASQDSIEFTVAGAGEQNEGVDYTVNYTGGDNNKTRLTFAGGLATGGISALVSGDIVVVYYMAY